MRKGLTLGETPIEFPLLAAGGSGSRSSLAAGGGGDVSLKATTRSNTTTDAAEQRISQQPQLAFERISCKFDDGRLFLRGRVPSFYQKQLAQEAIAGMEGVDQVVNEIQVVW